MHKVLMLEDEEIIRRGLRTILEEVIGGYRVVAEAETGRAVIALAEEFQPDLVITDIRMPGVDGLEALKLLRSAGFDVPVVILSGHADFEYARRALACGARGYLLKPLDRGELAKLLDSLFGAPPDAEESEAAEPSRVVRETKRIVAENIGGDLGLQAVADRVRVNSQYLSKLFKEQTGENFSRYVSRLRVEKARRLLETTNLRVYEIAELCGFGSEKRFLAVFKETAGTTPSRFRNG